MAMNLHLKRQAEITFSESLQGFGVEEYIFTPEESITSRKMRLNGKLLEMEPDSSFPVFNRIQFPLAIP